MSDKIELSLTQSFERERFTRAIDESKDIQQLRDIAKTLLNGWFTQRAATNWMMRQALPKPATILTEATTGLDALIKDQ